MLAALLNTDDTWLLRNRANWKCHLSTTTFLRNILLCPSATVSWILVNRSYFRNTGHQSQSLTLLWSACKGKTRAVHKAVRSSLSWWREKRQSAHSWKFDVSPHQPFLSCWSPIVSPSSFLHLKVTWTLWSRVTGSWTLNPVMEPVLY